MPEGVADAWKHSTDESGMRELQSGFEPSEKFVAQAGQRLGLDTEGA
jgi:hypothetical protein